MNKTELIDELHEHINAPTDLPAVTKASIERVLDALGRVVQEELYGNGEVSLPRIGKLSVTARAARTGRNPQTGAAIVIPARRVPTFSASKMLKDFVDA